jgi:hypothetical protein
MRIRAGLPLVLFLLSPAFAFQGVDGAELKPEALAAWEKYARLTEARIRQELGKETGERPGSAIDIRRVRTLDQAGAAVKAPGAMIHHWKGTVLVPGARLDQVLRFVQDYGHHQEFFKEVEKSRLESRDGDTFKIFYRLKRTKVITVVYNTEHTVVYSRPGPTNASSRSVATKIAELNNPGTPSEREKPAGQDHGFLWRLNSYWRFSEQDGGVIVECESISLSRGIPFGLDRIFKGFVESVPRESLLNTLTSLRDGVKKPGMGH